MKRPADQPASLAHRQLGKRQLVKQGLAVSAMIWALTLGAQFWAAPTASAIDLSSAGPYLRRVIERHLAGGVARRFGVEIEFHGHSHNAFLAPPKVLEAAHQIASGTSHTGYLTFDASQPLIVDPGSRHVLSAGTHRLAGFLLSTNGQRAWNISSGHRSLVLDATLSASAARGRAISEAMLRDYFRKHLDSRLIIEPETEAISIPLEDRNRTPFAFGIDGTIAFGPNLGNLWVGDKTISGRRIGGYAEGRELMQRIHQGDLELYDPHSKISQSRVGDIAMHRELLHPRANRKAGGATEVAGALELALGPMRWAELPSLIGIWDYLQRHGACGTSDDALLSLQPSIEIDDPKVIAQLLVNWHDNRDAIHEELKPHPGRVTYEFLGPYDHGLIERIRPHVKASSSTQLRELVFSAPHGGKAPQDLDLNIADAVASVPGRRRVEFRPYNMHFDQGVDASLLIPIAHALSEVERAYQMVYNPRSRVH